MRSREGLSTGNSDRTDRSVGDSDNSRVVGCVRACTRWCAWRGQWSACACVATECGSPGSSPLRTWRDDSTWTPQPEHRSAGSTNPKLPLPLSPNSRRQEPSGWALPGRPWCARPCWGGHSALTFTVEVVRLTPYVVSSDNTRFHSFPQLKYIRGVRSCFS